MEESKPTHKGVVGPVIKPAPLRQGDLVAIVAPASNLKADHLARGVAEIERLGFRVKYEPEILDKAFYTAGDITRLNHS